MASLSFIPLSAAPTGSASGRLVFRPIWPQVVVPSGPEEGGKGGGSKLDYRWYDGQELRPNWYIYPEEKRKLKDRIIKVAKQKRKIERDLSFARSPAQLGEMMAALNKLQDLLAQLMALHQETVKRWKTHLAAEAEDEMEFMEMLNLIE